MNEVNHTTKTSNHWSFLAAGENCEKQTEGGYE